MAQTVSPIVNSEDRARLAAVVEDRNRPQKHIQRVRIILLSAERLTVLDVAARSGASRPSVWRWQQRFAEEGMAGLLRDKTRLPAARRCRRRSSPKCWLCPAVSRPKPQPTGRAAWWPKSSASV
jgi:hypothetical protein